MGALAEVVTTEGEAPLEATVVAPVDTADAATEEKPSTDITGLAFEEALAGAADGATVDAIVEEIPTAEVVTTPEEAVGNALADDEAGG